MKKLIFLFIAFSISLFSIIVINISPTINGLIDKTTWINESCEKYSNNYKYSRRSYNFKFMINEYKSQLSRCYQRKAMIGLEYIAFNFNIILGIISILLGIIININLFKEEKYIQYIGFIGEIIGIIGFLFTFIYFIQSWLVFTSPAGNTVTEHRLRINSDGFAVEAKEGKYNCIFYEKDNPESLYLRYSDYGNKYLGYEKAPIYGNKYDNCSISTLNISKEELSDFYIQCLALTFTDVINNCSLLFYHSNDIPSSSYKRLYNHWLITIILSFLISTFDIGFAFLGYLLFKKSKECIKLCQIPSYKIK